MRYWFLLVCMVLWISRTVIAEDALAVEAHFTAATQSLVVGEPVQLALSATFPPDATLVSWPDFPGTWGDFEVSDSGKLEISETTGGGQTYRQTIMIRLWEPGIFETPKTSITYQQGSNRAELLVPGLQFQVNSVLKADDTALRPLQGQVDVPYIPPALIIGAAGLLCAGAVWLIDQRRIRRRARPSANASGLDRTALAMLSRIDLKATEAAAVYAEVADCLRDYVTSQFHVAASELTTIEMLNALQPYLSKTSLNRLYQLMAQADLVKFANQTPDYGSAARYLDAAAQWIRTAAQETRRAEITGV